MPRMDGLSFLEQLMRHYPMPVVIVSSVTPEHSEAALRGLELGAVEVIAKPGSAYSVPEVGRRLVQAIRAAAHARLTRTERPAEPVRHTVAKLDLTHKMILLGASTGGPRALETVLRGLPADAPGTLVVQHMPASFTGAFAKRLDALCAIRVREAKDGDAVVAGQALIAPGDRHMQVVANGARYSVRLKDGPPVHHQRPAVDVLFDSAARLVGRNAVAALLTGMGADGAAGLRALRDAGALTIAEAEETCVVFGMPREAIRLGGACEVVPIDRVANALLAAAGRAA
jgi:two-component system chemotaxis response regulator CheB